MPTPIRPAHGRTKGAEIGEINRRLQTLLDSFWDGIIDRET